MSVNASGSSRGGSAKISVVDFSELKNIQSTGKAANTRPAASPRWTRIAGTGDLLKERCCAIAGYLAF